MKAKLSKPVKRIGVASDHGGFELKLKLIAALKEEGYTIVDFGAIELNNEDDYPDFVTPLAQAVAGGDLQRGIAICGSGVGACIAANKIRGARASMITDPFSAHQGVEDDDMNILCLGGNVTGYFLASELVRIFLNASFKGTERFVRRLEKISLLEIKNKTGNNI